MENQEIDLKRAKAVLKLLKNNKKTLQEVYFPVIDLLVGYYFYDCTGQFGVHDDLGVEVCIGGSDDDWQQVGLDEEHWFVIKDGLEFNSPEAVELYCTRDMMIKMFETMISEYFN